MMDINGAIQNFANGGYKNTGTFLKRFIHKHKLLLILLVVGIILFAIGLSSIFDSASKVSAAQREIDTIKNDIDTFDVGVVADEEVIVKHIDHGLDTSRWQKDEAIALTLLSPAFKWSDATAYNDNRKVLMKNFGEDHWLVTTFMPEYVPAYVSRRNESDGDNFDDGTHMWCDYSSFKSYVVNIDETTGVYSYAAIMSLTSAIPDSYEDMYKGLLRFSKSDPFDATKYREVSYRIVLSFDMTKDGKLENFNMFKLI